MADKDLCATFYGGCISHLKHDGINSMETSEEKLKV